MKNALSLMIFILISEHSIASYPTSDHFDGKKFHNLQKTEIKSLFEVFKWKLTSDVTTWPELVENKKYPAPVLPADKKLATTFINHATFLIQFQGVSILTDPVFSERVSPFKFAGPKRARLPGLSIEELPSVDVVLISHNHYDHLDLMSLKNIDGKFHPIFIVPLGNEKFLKEAGLQNVIELDWWKQFKVKDVLITFTPAQHWSSRTPFDRNDTLWGSFMMVSNGLRVYFGGDSGYAPHFKMIRERLGAPLLALLPIGAYEPRWFMKESHMNPEEAVMAHKDLEASMSLGMHFGTFQLTDEGIDEPVTRLKEALLKEKIPADNFSTLDQGESRIY